MRPRVLMVTGAYYPELSGGGLQARAVVRALKAEADFRVLTTSIDASLPQRADEDGVPIRRIFVDTTSARSKLRASAEAIGETDEAERCAVFLRQLDPDWPPG